MNMCPAILFFIFIVRVLFHMEGLRDREGSVGEDRRVERTRRRSRMRWKRKGKMGCVPGDSIFSSHNGVFPLRKVRGGEKGG